jgi:hypothetical protein
MYLWYIEGKEERHFVCVKCLHKMIIQPNATTLDMGFLYKLFAITLSLIAAGLGILWYATMGW